MQLRYTNSNELRKIIQYACVIVIGKEQAGVTVTMYDSTRKESCSNVGQIILFPTEIFHAFSRLQVTAGSFLGTGLHYSLLNAAPMNSHDHSNSVCYITYAVYKEL
jgi:hypothetical protein